MTFVEALALLARIVLMPITSHSDLFFVQYYPHLLSAQAVWDIYSPDQAMHFPNAAIRYYPPLVYYAIAFFQKGFGYFAPGLFAFLSSARDAVVSSGGDQHLKFWTTRHSAESFFLLIQQKLPYFLFEWASFAALRPLFDAPQERVKITHLFLRNPVLVFSSYVVGQYRILPMFFIVGSLLSAKRRNWKRAGFFYGLACLLDHYALLLAPLWLLSVRTRPAERAKLFFWTALPVAGLLIPLWIHSQGGVLAAYFSPTLKRGFLTQGFFNWNPALVSRIGNALFFSVYGAIAIRILFRKTESEGFPGNSFIPASAIVLLTLYATHVMSIHYWMWILPFLFFMQIKSEAFKPVWVKALVAALYALLFLFNLDSRPLNLGLFVPLSPDLGLAPSLHEWMESRLPWGRVIAASRALFSAACLVLAWRIFKVHFRSAVPAAREIP